MNIGLTYTGSEEKHNNYIRWLKQGDAATDIITLSAETKENKGNIKDCEAFLRMHKKEKFRCWAFAGAFSLSIAF